MKYLRYIVFFILISCMPTKKTYLCEGVKCKNNKEMKQNFEKTLTMEVFVKTDNHTTIDLVELNANKEGKKINNKKFFFKNLKNPLQNLREKNSKRLIKNDSLNKNTTVKKVKLTKKKPNLVDKIQKKIKSNIPKQVNKNKKIKKADKSVLSCKVLNECNESEILEYFNNKANMKNYPDITSN